MITTVEPELGLRANAPGIELVDLHLKVASKSTIRNAPRGNRDVRSG